MSRHFTIRKMLRMTPNRLLRDFFRRLGHRLPAIDWQVVPEQCDEELMFSLESLSLEARGEIEARLAEVHDLACEFGAELLTEAANSVQCQNFVSLLPQAGPYHVAMWAWLNFPGVFQHAAMMIEVENLMRWRKRNDLPRVTPRTSPDALRELAGGISQFLRNAEGRGQNCTVEHFQRLHGTHYFVAYPDDFMHTLTTHDETGHLRPHSLRPTFEIVFGYRPEEGTLELFAKVPSRIKGKLESLFGQIILSEEVTSVRFNRPFDLNRLKDRNVCLVTDPADALSASITSLRIASRKWGSIGFDPPRNASDLTVYDVIDGCLRKEAMSWSEVCISQAAFRFSFQPLRGRRSSMLDFAVTFPDHCSAKSRRPEHLELMLKYLRLWGISHD